MKTICIYGQGDSGKSRTFEKFELMLTDPISYKSIKYRKLKDPNGTKEMIVAFCESGDSSEHIRQGFSDLKELCSKDIHIDSYLFASRIDPRVQNTAKTESELIASPLGNSYWLYKEACYKGIEHTRNESVSPAEQDSSALRTAEILRDLVFS